MCLGKCAVKRSIYILYKYTEWMDVLSPTDVTNTILHTPLNCPSFSVKWYRTKECRNGTLSIVEYSAIEGIFMAFLQQQTYPKDMTANWGSQFRRKFFHSLFVRGSEWGARGARNNIKFNAACRARARSHEGFHQISAIPSASVVLGGIHMWRSHGVGSPRSRQRHMGE